MNNDAFISEFEALLRAVVKESDALTFDMGDLLAFAIMAESYELADKIVEKCDQTDDINTSEMLADILDGNLSGYRAMKLRQLRWVFSHELEIIPKNSCLATKVRHWDYNVLGYYLTKCGSPVFETFNSTKKIWDAASSRKNSRVFYDLLLKHGIPIPSDDDLPAMLLANAGRADVDWFIEHGSDVNLWSISEYHSEQSQPLIATVVCRYAETREKKYYVLAQKLLAAGVNPDVELSDYDSIIRHHGAIKVVDVALDAACEDMMDLLLSTHKTKVNMLELRRDHYIKALEEKLNLR